MNYQERRNRVCAQLPDKAMVILYSGIPLHISADAYHPFEANRHFFYLTGLRRENMALVMYKNGESSHTSLYIEQADPTAERWTGKMVTADEARQCTGIDDVRYIDQMESEIHWILDNAAIETCYFDTYRCQNTDMADYNLEKANAFAKKYPHIAIKNLWYVVTGLRMEKDEDEVALLQKAVDITGNALDFVMKHLHPQMKEYQAQADFEYQVYYQGAESVSFPTIAGSGKNGTMLHYETNRDTCNDGELLLMDLGARYEGYNADITRTYPINGRFSPRQRQVYEVVLRANEAVAQAAKPGMTLRQLNDICKDILAEGCIELGLMEEKSQIGQYYMHSVSHHLGIDVHDVTLANRPLTPGCVITNEPGLYIDQWEIGIRIEDDLLITKDGCINLSKAIPKTPDEIEAIMGK